MIKIIFIRHGESTENIARESGEKYDKDSIKLTKLGEEQATKTGKYLSKTFGKFDIIYTSPIKRCIQTSELIAKEIKYSTENIIQDKLLTEMGNPAEGLSRKEIDKLISENKKLTNVYKQINKEKDPFEIYNLRIKEVKIIEKDYDYAPNTTQIIKNCKNFLNKLKKIKEKKILIITHGGVIQTYLRILCNLRADSNQSFFVTTKPFTSNKDIFGNCCYFCVGLNDGKFNVVMPPNVYHLQ